MIGAEKTKVFFIRYGATEPHQTDLDLFEKIHEEKVDSVLREELLQKRALLGVVEAGQKGAVKKGVASPIPQELVLRKKENQCSRGRRACR